MYLYIMFFVYAFNYISFVVSAYFISLCYLCVLSLSVLFVLSLYVVYFISIFCIYSTILFFFVLSLFLLDNIFFVLPLFLLDNKRAAARFLHWRLSAQSRQLKTAENVRKSLEVSKSTLRDCSRKISNDLTLMTSRRIKHKN